MRIAIAGLFLLTMMTQAWGQSSSSTTVNGSNANGVASGTEVANTSTTDANNVLADLKKSKLGMRFETKSVTERKGEDAKKVSNVYNHVDTFLSYSQSTNNVFYVNPRFLYGKTSPYSQKKVVDSYSLQEDTVALRYDRINLLNEEDHGLNLTTSSRYYVEPSDRARYRNQNVGFYRQDFVFTKKFNDKFSILSDNRFMFYMRDRQYSGESANKYQHNLYFIPSYQINERLTASLELLHVSVAKQGKAAAAQTVDYLRTRPGLDYNVTDSFVVGTAIYNKPLISHDGKALNKYDFDFELNTLVALTPDFKILGALTLPVTASDQRNVDARYSGNHYEAEIDLIVTAF